VGKGVPLGRRLQSRSTRKLAALVLGTLLVVVLAWADRRGLFLFQGGDLARYHGRWFDVAHVVDGDTLDIASPDGDRPRTRIRLWGINAPETAKPGVTGQPWADEASARLHDLCLGRQVRLWLEPSRLRDKYGRLLAHIELSDGTFANETLLLEGLAYDDDRWAHGRQHRYSLLAEQARRDKVGVWSDDRIPAMQESALPPPTSPAGRWPATWPLAGFSLDFASEPRTMTRPFPPAGDARGGLAWLSHTPHHGVAARDASADDPSDRGVPDDGAAGPRACSAHPAPPRRPGRVRRTDAAARRPSLRPAVLGSHPRCGRCPGLAPIVSPSPAPALWSAFLA
jgi:micrococcal nuclease